MFVTREKNNAVNIKADEEGTPRSQGKQLISNPCTAHPNYSVSTNIVIEIMSELCMIHKQKTGYV